MQNNTVELFFVVRMALFGSSKIEIEKDYLKVRSLIDVLFLILPL